MKIHLEEKTLDAPFILTACGRSCDVNDRTLNIKPTKRGVTCKVCLKKKVPHGT